MPLKETLVVLDFDGLLIDSYELLKVTFDKCGLDVGDEGRFQNRRKFLKYIGGGKELIGNLVNLSLPKKNKIREQLTNTYCKQGKIYPEFVTLLNDMIDSPNIHVGVVSRNFTYHPGKTIRHVLKNSKVNEAAMDFIIPISAGVKKGNVLEGMKASSYKHCIFAADEISDYRAAHETGYNKIFMASYGFDTKDRLIKKGEIPEDIIYETPKKLQKKLQKLLLKLS
jgi:phosphoglycolate phosphatase